jgi:uncharacterized integral membrane protein
VSLLSPSSSSSQTDTDNEKTTNLFDNKHIWMWILGGFFIFIIVGILIVLWVKKKGRL